MKRVYLFVAVFFAYTLVFASNVYAQSFTVFATPSETTISVGDSVKFTVVAQPDGGFDATVFFTLKIQYPDGHNSELIELGTINYPYNNTITIVQKPMSTTDTGTYILTITGANGTIRSNARCIMHITSNSVWKWKVADDFDKWGNRIIRGLNGAVVGIDARDGSNIRLNSFQNGEWTTQIISDGFEDSHGQTRYKLDKQGALWAVNYGDVYRFKNNLKTIWSKFSGFNGRAVDIMLDNADTPIIKTINSDSIMSIYRFSGGEWQKLYQLNDTYETFTEIPKFCFDSAGYIWTSIGYHTNAGVARWPDGDAEVFPTSILGNNNFTVKAIFCDRRGKIWCLHGDSSISASVFDGTSWSAVDFPNIRGISAVEIDGQNNIWIAFGSRLFQCNGTDRTEYNSSNSPLPEAITRLVADGNDNIWIAMGTYGDRGGVIFNPNGLRGIPIILSAEDTRVASFTDLSVFPNPVSDYFNVSAPDNSTVTARDVFGRVMYSGAGGAVSVSDWPQGIYFIETTDSSGRRNTAKLIVTR
ncbi:hypothetical protein MASR2M18_19360 [Ignavibacteria bacterium]